MWFRSYPSLSLLLTNIGIDLGSSRTSVCLLRMSCPACIVSYIHLSPLIPAVCSRSSLLSLRSPPSCLPLLCFVNKHIDNHNISQPFVGTSPRLSKRHGIGTFLLSSYPPVAVDLLAFAAGSIRLFNVLFSNIFFYCYIYMNSKWRCII